VIAAMTLEDINYIAQIVAAAAVVASLLFVGLQLRANAKQLRIATEAGYYTIYRDHVLTASSPDVADIFLRGFQGQEGLSESERIRLNAYYAVITRGYQVLHHQVRQKVFDTEFWDSAQNHYADLLGSKAYQQYWATRRHHFNPSFQRFTDHLIANHPKAKLIDLPFGKTDGSAAATPPPSP